MILIDVDVVVVRRHRHSAWPLCARKYIVHRYRFAMLLPSSTDENPMQLKTKVINTPFSDMVCAMVYASTLTFPSRSTKPKSNRNNTLCCVCTQNEEDDDDDEKSK